MTHAPIPLNEWLAVRLVTVVALVAGAYVIVMRLQGLIQSTVLNEFPIVTTVLALFAYLTLANLLLFGIAALARPIAPSRM